MALKRTVFLGHERCSLGTGEVYRLEQHYLNKTVSYQDTIPALGGVKSFIAVVRKGVEARRSEREARLRKYGIVTG
jgi:hypothetical protein